MKFDPKIHHRRSIRLHEHDYTRAGAYFITMVTHQRHPFFGKVVDGVVQMNELGQIAHDQWFKAAELRPYVELFEDEFVVMPNHVHGIIWIKAGTRLPVGARRRRAHLEDHIEKFGKPVPGSIPTIVRAYKSAVTHAANAFENSRGAVLWQRNYYEHVIRNEKALRAIRNYILANPLNCEKDEENPGG